MGNWTPNRGVTQNWGDVAQTDLLGQATRQRFDARGRVIERISESSPGVVELTHRYVFDTGIGGKGQLAEETTTGRYTAWTGDATLASDFRRTYSYDSLGRPVGSVTTIDGTASAGGGDMSLQTGISRK